MQPIMEAINQVCVTYQSPEVCKGYMGLHEMIIRNFVEFNLKPEFFCEQVYPGVRHQLVPRGQVRRLRTKRVLSDKPAFIDNDDFVQKLYDQLPPNKTFTAVHISDLHLDLNYQVGANSNCKFDTCCRANSGPVTDACLQGLSVWRVLLRHAL